MLIGILRETAPRETRVAATPRTIGQLRGLGYDVVVEAGAGMRSGFPDDAYEEAGARIGDACAADVVLAVNAPPAERLSALRPGATLIGLVDPRGDRARVADLAKRHLTVLAMDAVPRISRAQSMDVLSSMANLAGYRAVIEAAHEFGRPFTGQVTAAGKIPPARVFVVGAGVAGLAAIGAASALGAVVRAFDVRPEVAEQVRSMGAEFVTVGLTGASTADGYAAEMTAAQERATAAMYDEEARNADIVITTALVPGRPAPKLIGARTVAAMARGSVIVDLAAANGGNCGLTVPGERTTTESGVTVLGYTDLAARLPAQASQLYGTNVVNLVRLMTPGADGRLVVDFDDVVIRSMTVVRDGELTWPPPPVPVSAASPAAAPGTVQAAEPRAPLTPAARLGIVAAAAVVVFGLIAIAPERLQQHLVVFALAVVVGFAVIGNVAHALHTPLMSVTNAISGIIVVGALLQAGGGSAVTTALSAVAVLVAGLDIAGGFAVTRRMLAMFTRG
ncbi:Re/Si-specific NAD(P)(+) transhydrogenase subunit alpha [Amycolatopsis thermoflava]|uniref:proton-translocating NAD(P)(+) transhydrogenase n=1 Tax=Amycolatopsis thermoflava TaxID=84480 RepID=A0A3N2GQR8_9PSEU|nr:Re/Si-specific NAD(P)(+) transhydrogenase subunit alpha [Amycolatopsis thermoflava]ROS38579.1 NAD(P) transhydrogenase alpha subunit [Amycolatopsis thermoflava]